MIAPTHALRAALTAAIERALGEPEVDPLLVPSRQPGADLQANFAMKLAKQRGEAPRAVAERVATELGDADGLLAKTEVSGPGFLNLTFAPGALAEWATAALADERLGVAPAAMPQTVVVDYSAPNVAKEMHVGHLRSTVIGDALVRTLEFEGHTVVRANHLGDWGTQFGMLTQHMLDSGIEHLPDFAALGELYRAAKARFDADPAFTEAARSRVVALQAGDPGTLALWRDLVTVSLEHINAIYRRLDVTLTDEHVVGESFYNPLLAPTVDALLEAAVATESRGAVVVASTRFTNQDGTPAVLIIRKSDGGYGYGVTDLAAIDYRVRELDAHRMIYVTDARQAQHFAMVFDAAAKAGWTDGRQVEHVPFGAMLGDDGRPFKTRSGGTVALTDLLDSAIERAQVIVDEKNPDVPAGERAEIARAVGIGAVKYADLSTSRQRDLIFSFDRMLALDGNTAPYLLYAAVRAGSIATRAGETATTVSVVTEPVEQALLLKLAAFGDVLDEVAATLEPHRLCTYLYELAGQYTSFYEACPVLKADTPEQRRSRLAMCTLTAETLKTGLGLLGITVPARM
ncbi:arginine--tRNA ligase [Solirubrobacter phytolaccae]|uniref:Arginine--tRNA ligase n=1 Tax=Solirubrobacter phytolaccae TaxID=1404360 RepID=A0A9X3N4J5_9ACTN|nr:arginine--tRNA ligase [Solirubrobacter phytolaccae]MDA0179371.1 arginine--tRNA ligase [Solirubrobacter phytolaccae]